MPNKTIKAIAPIMPPAIAPAFAFDFCAAPVPAVSFALPAAVVPALALAAAPAAVEVTVTVLIEVTALGVIVVVTVEMSGVSGGVTIRRSRKRSAAMPVLVIVKVWEAAGRVGDVKKIWLYCTPMAGVLTKVTGAPPSME